MDKGKYILKLLIMWYEDSPAYERGELPSKRRVLRLYDDGKSNLPDYDIENHTVRNDFNKAVLALADAGYIEYEWMRGQQNHIMAKVWLRLESISDAYKFLNLTPKDLGVNEAVKQLTLLSESSKQQWVVSWAESKIIEITNKRKIGNSLPKDSGERQDLLKALSLLDTETEILERVFSIKCFGDSKRFEKTTRRRLIKIIKENLAIEDDCSDEAALRLVGVARYPEQFEFAGAISLNLPDGIIDYSMLPSGGIITSENVNVGCFTFNTRIDHILSIENKANYIDYVRKIKSENELVLLHGGQFSPAKRVFLQKIISAMPDGCSFSHWGDIDFGGFSMLSRIRREIYSKAKPYKMSSRELKTYKKFCTDFDTKYHNRLSSLLKIPNLHDCEETLKYMLENYIRLEQESML